MTPARQTKTGGILIGLIIAMLAAGVLSAAMVKSLQSQSVTSGRIYNVMRARYAADSGYTYFSSLSKAERLAYIPLGEVHHTMLNGDEFVITVSTNSAYIFSAISGRMMAGKNVVAVRTLTARTSISDSGGSGGGGSSEETIPGDDLVKDIDPAGVSEIAIRKDGKDYKKNLDELIRIKGAGNYKEWEETHAVLLNLHEKFIAQELNTLRGTSLKVRTDLDVRHAEIESSEKNHVIWAVALPLNYQEEAQEASEDGYLAYNAQVKVSWQEKNRSFYSPYSRVTGAQGLAFKLHGTEADGYEFYAVTLMRFLDEKEDDNQITGYDELDKARWSPNLVGWSNNDGYWGTYDCIPNDIKPPGQKEKYLLVLWKQANGKSGQKERTWIAYQDLSGDSIANANFMLDATIHIRVTEGIESTAEFFDVQMLAGDSRANDAPPGDGDPYNRGWWSRRRYRNATDLPDSFSTVFPIWPPLLSQNWTASVDYYTLAKSSATVLNKEDKSANFQSDGETIRIYDEDFIFKNQKDALGDLGLVFCGNFMSGIDHDKVTKDGVPKVKKPSEDDYREIDIPSLYMAVDDLAVQWSNGTVQTGTGAELITGF